MQRFFTALFSVLMICVSARPAAAHPGHGSDGGDHSLLHYLTQPSHMFTAVTIAAVFAIVYYVLRRRTAQVHGIKRMAWARDRP